MDFFFVCGSTPLLPFGGGTFFGEVYAVLFRSDEGVCAVFLVSSASLPVFCQSVASHRATKISFLQVREICRGRRA